MKKKSLLLALASATLAASMGATVVANAGINTNQPFGDGLIKNGAINNESFITLEDDAGAYSAVNGNGTLTLTGVEWRAALFTHNNPIPKADLTEGTKVVLQYDVYNLGAMWDQCVYFAPLSTTMGGWDQNYMTMRINTNCIQGYNAPAGSEVYINNTKVADNTSKGIGTDPTFKNENDFGLQANVLNAQKAKGNDHCTYWLEYDITAKSLTLYGGNADANEKTEYATVKNAFTLTDGDNYYMNFAYDNSYEIDNVKVYSVKGETRKDYLNCQFSTANDYMVGGSGEEADRQKLVLAGSAAASAQLKTYDTVVKVVNPAENARLTTVNKLKTEPKLEVSFLLEAKYRLTKLNANRKVGIAFGLDGYRTSLGSPANKASFIYLSLNEEGKVVLGAEEIAEDGTATALITPEVLEGVTQTSDVDIKIEGRKNGSADVTIGERVYNVPNVKADGHVSFTQTGTGDVTYSFIVSEVELTGYELAENEGEAVTASFDNNYISTSKFALQSKDAPAAYLTAQDGAHEATGITAEDGRVGFYGTGTNTRLMFNEKYADFVLQFDYISEPVSKRMLPSGLTTGNSPNRYSPLYVIFGAENECPELAQTYAYGIIEGNMTQYFWGAESLITKEGKLGSGLQAVTASMTRLEAKEEGAIPCYYSGFELAYGKPAPITYSFYNKTTRVKFVAINNNVAMYAAEVDADGNVGEYVKLFESKVENSYGNVGFGTDAPAWAIIDNVAITPISTETVVTAGINAVPSVDLVADVAVKDMVADTEPLPLAKAVVTVDATAKKATWTAVEGAKEYTVTVKLGTEKKIEKTVTATEIDLSELTEVGEYKIRVTAVPEDEDNYLKSNSAEVTYTIEDKTSGGDSTSDSTVESASGSDSTTGGTTSSSGGCSGSVGAASVMTLALAIGAAVICKKGKKD